MPQTALEVEVVSRCPVCGETETELVLTQPDGYIPELRLRRCAHCAMVFLSPRLTIDSIVAVEDESEVYNYTPQVIEEVIGNSTRLVEWLESSYLPARTGDNRRLLDIGCNRGLLLEAARRAGWQVTGVEISPEAAQRARNNYGLIVYAGVDDVPQGQTFDLITAWHVLEHTLDPVAFLKQAAERLTPEGIIAIQVPSFDYVEEFRARDQLGSILCTVHNFYFTEQTMQTVIETAGLRVLHVSNDPRPLFLTAICARSTREIPKRSVSQTLRRLTRKLAKWRG